MDVLALSVPDGLLRQLSVHGRRAAPGQHRWLREPLRVFHRPPRLVYGAVGISILLSIGDSVVKEGWDEILISPEYTILNFGVLGQLAAGTIFDRRWMQVSVAGILVLLTIGSMLVE